MSRIKTSIIILTHNQLELTTQCLDSIRKYTPEPYELIVVDNNSTDGTVSYLEQQADVKKIYNKENLGFAKGCNQGVAISTGENVLFLNNDTVVTEHWFKNMLRALYSDEKVGMVGPVTNYVSGHQKIPVTYQDTIGLHNFAQEYCSQHAGLTRRVHRLVGFCLLVKKKVLDDIGLFDERFGIGNYEDDDLCFRAVNRDYVLLIALDSFIHHVGHATFNNTPGINLAQLLHENKIKAFQKWGFDLPSALLSRITISLCMILKNEEETIARCLDTVKDAVDEIIIVDTGSTDRTKDIVRQYSAKIYDFEWIDDFAAARNFAFSHATMDYLMWLDADDVLLEEDLQKLLKLKSAFDPSIDSVTMNYHLAFDESGKPMMKLRRNRLVRRVRNFRWHGAVHEYLEVHGIIYNSNVDITHLKQRQDTYDRNLMIYEKRLAKGELFSPRDLYYYAKELHEHGFYVKAIEFYMKFLDTNQGWVEDVISACGKIADCYNTLGDKEKEIEFALKSFEYDTPRAEFCCRLGYHFLQEKKHHTAIFWYKLATQLEKPDQSWGLLNEACWTWLPHLQLCVCYDLLGQHEAAWEHNEIARSYQPNKSQILHNKNYLMTILKK